MKFYPLILYLFYIIFIFVYLSWRNITAKSLGGYAKGGKRECDHRSYSKTSISVFRVSECCADVYNDCELSSREESGANSKSPALQGVSAEETENGQRQWRQQ